jgi:hypothetical protein
MKRSRSGRIESDIRLILTHLNFIRINFCYIYFIAVIFLKTLNIEYMIFYKFMNFHKQFLLL